MMVPVEFVCQAFDVSLRIGRVAVVQSPDRGGRRWVRLGTIVGRVTYGGAPAAGIRVRLVRAKLQTRATNRSNVPRDVVLHAIKLFDIIEKRLDNERQGR